MEEGGAGYLSEVVGNGVLWKGEGLASSVRWGPIEGGGAC